MQQLVTILVVANCTGTSSTLYSIGGIREVYYSTHVGHHSMQWSSTTSAFVCRSKQGKAVKPPKQSKTEREAGEKREQMAAAAEARMARLKLASQQQQLWS